MLRSDAVSSVAATKHRTQWKPKAKTQAKDTNTLAKPGRKRELQDSRLYNLKLDINDLKQDIARLKSMRSILMERALNRYSDADGTCYKAAMEYFRVFANGFMDSPFDAVSYINHAMAEDIYVNNFSGRHVVIEQWKMYSAVFDKIRFQFISAAVLPLKDGKAVVRAHARFYGAITRQTLMIMFPHIVGREDIFKKLVGKAVTDIGRYDFVIDAKTHQILRCDVVLDYFNCFAKLLPNVKDLATLFGHAMIHDEFYIGELDELPPPPPPSQVALIEEIKETTQSTGSPRCEDAVGSPKMQLDHILSSDDEMLEDIPGHAY